jgi:hypothetical protein
MEILRDLILVLIPALLVGAAVYFLLKIYLKRDEDRRAVEYKTERMKMISPVRLQAYERIVLLLERITPSQLIMRNIQQGMNARELQQALIGNIRQEYDHNLSQQLYISSNAWELVKNAREALISAINTASESLKEDATATDLAQLIFQDELNSEGSTLYKALEYLKKEARELF